MLEAIDFKQLTCDIPSLTMLEPTLVQQMIDLCVQHNGGQAGVYYNIKKLHQLLLSELQHRHGTAATIQRSAFYQVKLMKMNIEKIKMLYNILTDLRFLCKMRWKLV